MEFFNSAVTVLQTLVVVGGKTIWNFSTVQ